MFDFADPCEQQVRLVPADHGRPRIVLLLRLLLLSRLPLFFRLLSLLPVLLLSLSVLLLLSSFNGADFSGAIVNAPALLSSSVPSSGLSQMRFNKSACAGSSAMRRPST